MNDKKEREGLRGNKDRKVASRTYGRTSRGFIEWVPLHPFILKPPPQDLSLSYFTFPLRFQEIPSLLRSSRDFKIYSSIFLLPYESANEIFSRTTFRNLGRSRGVHFTPPAGNRFRGLYLIAFSREIKGFFCRIPFL